MKSQLLSGFGAFSLTLALSAATPVAWKAVPNTGVAETDVCNEGFPVFAYTYYGSTGARTSVNGVEFLRVAGLAGFQGDVAFDPAFQNAVSVFYGAEDVETPYRYLLAYGYYGPASAMSVELKGLVPGRTYRAQFFFTDLRNSSRWARIGGQTVKYAGDGFEKGGSLVGDFVATGGTYRVDIAYSNGAQQLNAINVRQVSTHLDDAILSVNKTTGAETDVETRGELVFASATSQTTVNGVPFAAMTAPGGKVCIDEHVDCAVGNGKSLNLGAAIYVTDVIGDLPDGYQKILKGSAYVDDAGYLLLTFKGLTPGARYLFQLWTSDSRANGDSRSCIVEGRATLRYRNGTTELPYGNNVTGVFIANGAEKTVSIRPRAGASIQVNALQLRRIGVLSSGGDRWTASPLTGTAATDVRADGQGLFAYVCHANPQAATTMNGVPFAAAAASSGIGDVVTFSPAFDYTQTVFCPDTVQLDEAYRKFLKYASYGSHSPVDFTFLKLQPGFRYLAQFFLADLRNNDSRSATAGGATAYYNAKSDESYPFGGTLIGEISAIDGEKTIPVSYSSANAQHLNALQFRLLGFDGLTRAANAGANWSASGDGWLSGDMSLEGRTVWDETNGPTNSAGFASDAALTLTSDVWADMISSRGALTVDGADHLLTVGYGVFAPVATINAKWGSRYLTKTGSGRLTLAGGCPVLEQALVTDGTVVFASDPAKAISLEVAASGVVEVTAGRAVTVSSLAGTGTLKGPGRVDFASGEAVEIPSGLVRDGIVWGLVNGTTLEYAEGADLSGETIYVDDPETAKAEDRVVVHVTGSVTGKPKFVFAVKGYRAAWDAEASGYKIVPPPGLVLLFR